MSYEQRDNSGALFINDRKRPDKNDADYTGSVMVGGKHYWINAWKKDTQKPGAKFDSFFSLSFRPKDAAAEAQRTEKPAYATPTKPASQRTPADDVPF